LKKGIVRDARVHARICAEIENFVTALGWRVEGVVPSVIPGRDGNREFFIAASHD
jgi:23S rRNA (cytidine1920-2'-O)/16S rRNA (cytidine1409-2'-O)-methyltransferase